MDLRDENEELRRRLDAIAKVAADRLVVLEAERVVTWGGHETRLQRMRHWVGWRDGVRLCDGACGRPDQLDEGPAP